MIGHGSQVHMKLQGLWQLLKSHRLTSHLLKSSLSWELLGYLSWTRCQKSSFTCTWTESLYHILVAMMVEAPAGKSFYFRIFFKKRKIWHDFLVFICLAFCVLGMMILKVKSLEHNTLLCLYCTYGMLQF